MKNEDIALVNGFDLPISTKHSIEICNFIRSKNVKQAKTKLGNVLEKKLAIPLKRFHKDRGHRKGDCGPGFFPENATKQILNLLNTLEANANNKGLNSENLYIKEIIANKASTPARHGRHRGRSSKRTHIKIVAQEREIKKASKEKSQVASPKSTGEKTSKGKGEKK